MNRRDCGIERGLEKLMTCAHFQQKNIEYVIFSISSSLDRLVCLFSWTDVDYVYGMDMLTYT